MEFREELSWILDKPGTTMENQDEKFRENIEFVHSLGLKCDCVGWSELDLASPRAEEILQAIERFCREEGWTARGWYTRKFVSEESDWYEIKFNEPKDGFFGKQRQVPGQSGEPVTIWEISACKELDVGPKGLWMGKMVPERFRDAVVRLEGNADFCWAPDRGKYESEQYFHIYPRHSVSHIGGNRPFDFNRKEAAETLPRIQALGGWLPRLAEVFEKLRVVLYNCYLASELPAGGFAGVYLQLSVRSIHGEQHILVHREMAQRLLKEKALPESCLVPVSVLDEIPGGFGVWESAHLFPPAHEVCQELLVEYERCKATPRPVRMVTEKEALKLLRKAKKERGEDFQKAMTKAKAEALAGSAYAMLIPYYRVANGGFLSYEYTLLSSGDAAEKTDAFFRQMEAEELLEEKPEGVVFAICPDGDAVLLSPEGIVSRFSHEAPEIIAQWPGLPRFIVDAIQDAE